MIECDREPHQVFSLLAEVLVEDRAQPIIEKSRGSNENRYCFVVTTMYYVLHNLYF